MAETIILSLDPLAALPHKAFSGFSLKECNVFTKKFSPPRKPPLEPLHGKEFKTRGRT